MDVVEAALGVSHRIQVRCQTLGIGVVEKKVREPQSAIGASQRHQCAVSAVLQANASSKGDLASLSHCSLNVKGF